MSGKRNKKRAKHPDSRPPAGDDTPSALAALKGFSPFDLDRSWHKLRDEADGVALSRHGDELFISRLGLRHVPREGQPHSIAATAIREVRLSHRRSRQGGFHGWHLETADYSGNSIDLAQTRDAEKAWEFAATLARLLNVPLAHGKNFHRRIPVEALRDSLWVRADRAPLDVAAPAAPPGMKVKEHDGAVELLINDVRKVSPQLREWASFMFGFAFVGLIVTAFSLTAFFSERSGLSRVGPTLGAALFVAILYMMWKERPRPRTVTASIRVTSAGQVIWEEKAGGRLSKGIYDLSQYLDLSVDPAYFISIDGEEPFPTRLDPEAKEPIGRWLDEAITYCRALHTGRRRQALLDRIDTTGAPATDLLKADPVPVKLG